jgi:RNA polymerase sigma-70 factor (ECF subfamily)
MLAMTAPPTDDELLASDEPEDFALFYRRHLDWVLGYLQRRTRDPELAADLCAEVFAAALLARRRYRPRDGHANSWLFSIAHNKLTDAQRRGHVEQRARTRLGMQRVVPDERDLAWIEALGEEVDVAGALASLPEEQRAAVTARVVHDRDYPEMAAREGVTEAVMRKRVSRGLAAMRARLGGRT